MAGQAVGTLYVELDLDATRYTRGQTQLLRDSQTASETLEKNFQNLGIKSSAHMDLMRSKVKLSYDAIVNDARSTANDILRAEEAKNRRLQEINNMQFGQQKTMLETVKQHWFAFTAAIGAAYAAMSAGKEFVDAALAMERINSTLKATMGSGEAAAREFAFISNESKRLGLNLESTALAFGKFAASTKNTSIEGEETRKIFLGVSEAVTAMKLPAETADGIFLALSQMMSKGKISAEELSGQLGERLPGAVKLTADAMGMTTQELLKNMQAGKLMSSDVLPALAEQLHKTYGAAALEAAEGGQAAINRFNNTMFETKAAIGAALMPALSDALTAFSGIGAGIQRIVMNTQLSFVELFGFVDKVVATVKMVGSALSFDATAAETFSNRMKNIRTAVDEQKKHITNMYEKSTDAAYTAADKQTQATVNALRKQKEAVTGAAKHEDAEVKKLASEKDRLRKQEERDIRKAYDTSIDLIKREVDWGVEETKRGIEEKKEYEESFRNWERDTWAKQALYEREVVYKDKAKVSADTWDEIQRYEYLTGEKIQKDQIKFVGSMLSEYEDTFAGGVKAALLDISNHQTTWGQTMSETTKALYRGMSDSFSTLFEDIYKGKLKSVGDYTTAIWDTTRETFFKMLADMAAKKIMMFFEASWTSAGAEALGIINKLLGYFTGSGGSDSTIDPSNGIDYAGPGVAYGGLIPGTATGGDSPANDTFRARLSPGEYVIPRSVMQGIAAQGRNGDTMLAHINPVEAALLKSIGGSGTINPNTGLREFSFFSKFLDVIKSAATGGMYDVYEAVTDSHDIWDFVDRIVDPGGSVDYSLREIGEAMPEWLRKRAPAIGAIVGNLAYGPWMAAAGYGAGAKIAGYDTKSAMEGASTAALFAWLGGKGGEGITSETGQKAAAQYVAKQAIGELIVAASGGTEGGVGSIKMTGDDNGVFKSLQGYLDAFAPQAYDVSARGGLDYIPRDNYRVNAHEGEAVLTKNQADKWRAGVGNIKIYLDGTEIGGLMKVVADDTVVKRNKRGVSTTRRVYQ
jgi:tape measure domain-containing protein